MKKTGILLLFAVCVYNFTAHADIMGMPAEITIGVLSCQQYPLDDARVILLGAAEAENDGDGNYRFPEVYPGEYTLFAYSPYSDSYEEKLLIGHSYSTVHLNITLCTCVESVRDVVIEVIGPSGKNIPGAKVSVPELFIEGETDKNGRAAFTLPPGEREITARADGSAGRTEVIVTAQDPGEEPEPVELVVYLE